jgi:nicotinamidase-related amidase
MDLVLTPALTALVVIDLQRGTVGTPTAPHPAGDVVAHAVAVAGALRALGGLIVLVHVTPSADGKGCAAPPDRHATAAAGASSARLGRDRPRTAS